MRTTIENVVVGGATGVSVVLFEDPREREVSLPAGQPLHRSLFLNEVRADLPAVEIPSYVRAFRRTDALLGPPTFLLVVADTSVEVLGLLAHVLDEGEILGYDPDCDALDASAQPRLFWVPSPQEAPILEGARFIDVSNDCGTTRGMTRSWSLFLASARDTRPTLEIARTKLAALNTLLAQAQCVDRRLVKSLQRKLETAQRQLDRGKYAAAADELRALSALILGSPGALTSCAVNEGGELRARAESAIFILEKL